MAKESDDFKSYEVHCRSMAVQAQSETEREQWERLADAWAKRKVGSPKHLPASHEARANSDE